MDIIPNKRSKLLYQKGDQEIKGVIDLRCFSSEKKKIEKEEKKKTVFEIIKKEDEKKEITKQTAFSKNKHSISNKIYNANRKFKIKAPNLLSKTEFLTRPKFKFSLLWQRSFISFVSIVVIISLTVFSLSFIQKGIEEKGKILGVSTQAYDYLKQAGQSASNQDFENSINDFDSARLNFLKTKTEIEKFGLGVSGAISNLPINSPISTAKDLAEAGENISLAGKNISALFEKISNLDQKNFLIGSSLNLQTDIGNIALNLKNAENNLNKVDLNYIPEEFREKIKLSKKELPAIANNFKNLSEDLETITEILGNDRPQKYLILFQNNSEIRPTGGFIGSYGILDIENGEIKNLFIDGVFNPDGQLEEKIVPPMPIQKISAAWSMHDANWFPDFPTSAKKIALFYEKTGGPTVDGVIAITPDVIEKMLEVTGPIEMQEYETTINKENFLIKTQLQVEELYDKEENRPKKFLSDLAPKIIEKLVNTDNLDSQEKVQKYLSFINIMEESLKEKHIIFYHRDTKIEDMIIKRGWGGQVLNSSDNYLSIVHTNINGYKTDAVIDEQIDHKTEILNDGSIINTVIITRKHLGGNSDFNWYNRVNSDYMRVYVPLGSVLLEAKGHTTQEYEPPIDYSDFKTDPDVKKIEDTIRIDPDSGTHIFEESGKTVFGNWVYVSPQKTVEVTYKYQLPYKINFDSFTKPADKYSILIQKQLGSKGSNFTGTIKLPDEWKAIWRSQGLNIKNFNESIIRTNLKTDRVYGVVFKNKSNG
ncbi:MAG: DUF4012 domain-containing protein [Candidatus Andersenbacteria bacterium]|nr:DUF4012 domain-containing protein [Candidatus Andersenbacteria bacterium]